MRTLGLAHMVAQFVLLLAPMAVLATTRPPLGLCPPETARLDGFMRTVCEGEIALDSGRNAEALARFRQAAELPRLQATNELAWAGLAATHCAQRDATLGHTWAARFDEARRLWLGELSCDSGAAQPQPFVRDHMCVDALVADYGFVKRHPQAPVSSQITARLTAVAAQVARYCAPATTAAANEASASPVKARKAAKKKPKKKLSGRKGSPARGR